MLNTEVYQMGLRDGALLVLKSVKSAVEIDPQLEIADVLSLLAVMAQQLSDYGGIISR